MIKFKDFKYSEELSPKSVKIGDVCLFTGEIPFMDSYYDLVNAKCTVTSEPYQHEELEDHPDWMVVDVLFEQPCISTKGMNINEESWFVLVQDLKPFVDEPEERNYEEWIQESTDVYGFEIGDMVKIKYGG